MPQTIINVIYTSVTTSQRGAVAGTQSAVNIAGARYWIVTRTIL